MENPSCSDFLTLLNGIPAASRGSCYNILVERKRNENNDGQEVNNSADSPHGLWTTKLRFSTKKSFVMIYSKNLHLDLLQFRHIFPTQARLYKNIPKPSDHAVCRGKSYAAKGQRCD